MEYSFDDEDVEIKDLMEKYNLEEDEARVILEIMKEYSVDVDEAIEINNSL